MSVQVATDHPPERWHFEAVYNDGTSQPEYGADGTHFGFSRHVDQERLVALMLLPQVRGLPAHVLHCTPGARAIFFRRRAHAVTVSGEPAGYMGDVTCLGLEPAGDGSATYAFFFDDGSVAVSNDLNQVEVGHGS